MDLVYLVMEYDIETSNVQGVFTSLPKAIERAAERLHNLGDWADTSDIVIDVWVVGSYAKIGSLDHNGKAK